MSTLSRTETDLQAYVLGAGEHALAAIAGPDEAFRRQRLDIYRDAYRLRLVEVLAADYPALRAVVGSEAFEALAADYLAAHPSTFRNVRWFGGALPGFLAARPDPASGPLPAELARFEWTLGLAFDGPDVPSVSFADVAAIAPEAWADLRLQPHPCLHLLKLRTNAVAMWKAHDAGGTPPATELLDAPLDWAIWRKDDSPYFRSLPADEAWALGAIREGATFGAICAGLCEWVEQEEAPLRAAQLLRGWVDEGWVAGLGAGGE
jgi:hypothetical protein